jgi:hypothetical protein
MYGMVNKSVQSMVCRTHGEPTWTLIRELAGVDTEEFLSNEAYPDDVTYRLVAAASQILRTPAAEVLELFGEHWVLHTAVEGYGPLLRAAGSTLPAFLLNLPNFHSRVAMIFTELQPPRFECTDITECSLKLHYFSHRQGLAPFVVGVVRGLGKMFETPATVDLVATRDGGADHDVFVVAWEPPTR